MKKEILSLNPMPLVNNLFFNYTDAINAKRYDLKIYEQENLTMKLDLEIPSDEMFSSYLYRSSVNIPYIDHCRQMWNYVSLFDPRRILDIGGNDGALLSTFKMFSLNELDLVNVDASHSFEHDNINKGIEYIQGYWGDLNFDQKFDVIVSTNVFQHNPDYHKFLNGISNNLNGIWVLEFPYFLNTVKTNQFDQVYHEHVFYWLLTPLIKLFKQYKLKIIDISLHEIHGGTMRIVSSNKPEHIENTNKINFFLKEEANFNFDNWNTKIQNKILKDKLFIDNLDGKTAAFGAAAKGCVYLNSINSKKIKYIIDDTIQKQGMFSPGTGLKIYSKDILTKDTPDNIIILAHNFKDFIAKNLRDCGYKGKIFTMIPNIIEIK